MASKQSPSTSTLSVSQLRSLRLSHSFPQIPSSLHLSRQLRLILHHLLAIPSMHPTDTLLAFWNRLPSPRPNRTTLSKYLVNGSYVAGLTRIYGCRSAIQCCTRRDARMLRGVAWGRIVKKLTKEELALVKTVAQKVRNGLEECNKEKSGIEIGPDEEELNIDWALLNSELGMEAMRKIHHDLGPLAFQVERLLVGEGVIEKVSGKNNVAAWRGVLAGKTVEGRNALVKCSGRYFKGYGPAKEIDFRQWLGIYAAESKDAIQELLRRGEVMKSRSEIGEILMPTGRRYREEDDRNIEEEVLFLGAMDPILLAHKDKDWVISSGVKRYVWSLGRIGQSVMIDGKIKGSWRRFGRIIEVYIHEWDADEKKVEVEKERVRDAGMRVLREFYSIQKGKVRIN